VTLTQGQSTYVYGDGTNIVFADSSKVASFNGRVGTVTLNASDVTTALGYTPYNSTNPAGYLTSSSFPYNWAASGYQYLPNGFLMQWGYAYGPNTTLATNYFPIAFPNACLSLALTARSSQTGPTATTWGLIIDKTSYSLYDEANGSIGLGYYMQAIGY
jgi:hypothetical protein